MTVAWPSTLLVPRTPLIAAAFRNTQSPPSVNGFVQTIASDAGSWIASFGEIAIDTDEKLREWRRLALVLKGRLNPVLITLYEIDRQPLPIDPLGPWRIRTVPQDPMFLNPNGPFINATIAADAALRATTIEIDVAPPADPELQSAPLEPAHFFSVGERLYQIEEVTAVAGTVSTVKIWPPLREAVTVGMVAEFDKPVCRMRLTRDDAMAIPLEDNRWAYPSLDFVEDPF